MQLFVGANRHGPPDGRLQLAEQRAAFILQGSGDLRIYPQDNAVANNTGSAAFTSVVPKL